VNKTSVDWIPVHLHALYLLHRGCCVVIAGGFISPITDLIGARDVGQAAAQHRDTVAAA